MKFELLTSSKSHLRIIQLISDYGFEARIVGGAVRDSFLGKLAKDVDIATNMLPQNVMNLLQKNSIKTIPTGIEHGTITAIIDNQPFEITTLRKDIECFGRKAKVTFTDSFSEDAARRDFTINALSYCPLQDKLYDYFNGIEDLQNGVVRFIGQAEQRISEDFLRILRFFRFSHRFANSLDQSAVEACRLNAHKLRELSKERIKQEIDLIFSAKNCTDICSNMHELGILDVIFPDSNFVQKELAFAELAAEQFHCSPFDKQILLYSAILNDNITKQSLTSLRFSKKEADQILLLKNLKKLDDSGRALQLKLLYIDHEDFAIYFAWQALIQMDVASSFEQFQQYCTQSKPEFPIKAADLIAKGLEGPAISQAMAKLRAHWAQSDFTLGKDDLIKLI